MANEKYYWCHCCKEFTGTPERVADKLFCDSCEEFLCMAGHETPQPDPNQLELPLNLIGVNL